MNVVSEMGLEATTDVIYTSDHGDNLGSRGLWGKSTMYEEIAGVPLICAGPSFPAGEVIGTPVSHVDAFPTLMQVAGEPFEAMRDNYPGHSLAEIARGLEPVRTVLSEYHGMGSTTGAYMIRVENYKYVYYVKYAPQLFDLQSDPDELNDLAGDAAMTGVLEDCRQRLFALLDPVEVDHRAKARQAQLLEMHGGREAVIARGDLGFTPAPGVVANFQ